MRGSELIVLGAGVEPQLARKWRSEGEFESSDGDTPEFGNGVDAALTESGGIDAYDGAESVQTGKGGEASEECGFEAWNDDAKAARAFEASGDGGSYAGMGGADSDAQAGTFENFELDAAESTGEMAADSR